MFNSYAKQDEFVANIFDFKKEGSYVDIGSANSVLDGNNTYFFDRHGWEGICLELDPQFNGGYGKRSCTYINANALTVDWKTIFKEKGFGKNIDYLSLDVDEASTETLLRLPLDEYKFKVITIEHDSYLRGHAYKTQQREHLEANGYLLLCGDVLVEQVGYSRETGPFEDWWVRPEFFSSEMVKKLSSTGEYPSAIIHKFNQ